MTTKGVKNSKISVKLAVKGYFEEVKSELRKVSWPTRSKVIRSSAVIIFLAIFFALYISGLDVVFSRLITFISINKY